MTIQHTWRPKPNAHDPADYDELVVYAVRAVYLGEASAAQQKLAWEWIMYVSGAGDGFQDLSYRPGGEDGRRQTDFAEGKRFVGLQIRKMLRPEVTPPRPVIKR